MPNSLNTLSKVQHSNSGSFGCCHRNTFDYYPQRLHQLIYQGVKDENHFFGKVEVIESYFGGKQKAKRGRGTAGKVTVFNILKHAIQIYTKIVPEDLDVEYAAENRP